MMVFLRRRKLGRSSTRGMKHYINSYGDASLGVTTSGRCTKAAIVRNDQTQDWRGLDLAAFPPVLIRWGCTTETQVPISNQLNTSQAIKRVNDKSGMRRLLRSEAPTLIPSTVFDLSETHPGMFPLVVRPKHHAQGRNLWVCQNQTQLLATIAVAGPEWYASQLIQKVAEYRVYVMSGRVLTVAQKTPEDPSAVAWNVAQGGRFDVVRWDQWPLEACRAALEAFTLSGLDFSGVDVMIDAEGRAYVIELNSAPSLPFLSDGSISYRQKCMAKGFMYIRDHGKEHFNTPDHYNNWKSVIHPAIWSR